MTTPRAEIGQRLIALLDAVDEPISIASSIRDRGGRILDFRIEYVNEETARWAGVPRESMIGLITGELLPEFRSSGFFDTLVEVVTTGLPHHEAGAHVADGITGGSWVGGISDMRAIRLGDGYISTWQLQTPTQKPSS